MTVMKTSFLLAGAAVLGIASSVITAKVIQPQALTGTADFKLGRVVGVSNWEADGEVIAGRCSVNVEIAQEVTSSVPVTGAISGRVHDDRAGFVYVRFGSIVNGYGTVTFGVSAYSKEACALKSSDQIKLSDPQLYVVSAVVQKEAK